MNMPAPETRWTVETRNALPDDGNRCKVIDGELFVTPAPRSTHEYAMGALYLMLAPYVKERKVGYAFFSSADIELAADTVVQPDLLVAPSVDGHRPKDWGAIRHLILAVEVLSPSTARLDRVQKRMPYQREGVDEYWIVDADAREVQRWRPTDERPEVLGEQLGWQPSGVSDEQALLIDLPVLFAEIADER